MSNVLRTYVSLFQSVIKQNVTEKALLQHYGEAVLVLDELLLAVSAPPVPPSLPPSRMRFYGTWAPGKEIK